MQDQFPGTTDAFERVRALVGAYRAERRARGAAGLELEARVGAVVDGRVRTGVTARSFHDTFAFVMTNPTVRDLCNGFEEFVDFFFDSPEGEVRCRSFADADAVVIRTEVVRKARLAECTLQAGDDVVRLVLSREVPVADGATAASATTTCVRIHRRARVAIGDGRPHAVAAPCWAIDFDTVWSGTTLKAAQRQRMATPEDPSAAQMSLEIELVDSTGDYVARHSDAYVATSLVMKAADLLDSRAFFALRRGDGRA